MSGWVYGFHPVREALRHRPQRVQRVLVERRRRGQRRADIDELCRRHRVRLEPVAASELSKVAPGVHNGFAAELSRAPQAADRRADEDLVVLLEDVQDPRNLGALLRSCEAAGVGRVLIRDRGSAPMSATVVKASAGASEWLDLERVVNSAATIEQLK